jgi:putative transposase
VQPHPDLSLRRQCELLQLSRSSLYYEEVEVSPEELSLMRRIDAIYTERPFYGSRRVLVALQQEALEVNRKRVQRLMRLMGLEALVPGPHTSVPHPENPVYPYLLRGVKIVRVDQVWSTDITYIGLAQGWAYLVAVIDWYSRAVLSWRLSNTMTVDFCVEALEEALRHHGPPEIFNSDQGAQFTSPEFTGVLKKANVKISMDGKGRALDNVFVERLWRSLKYEEVYLKDYADVASAREGIGNWFRFYNGQRPHQALGNQTPMNIYRGAPFRVAA